MEAVCFWSFLIAAVLTLTALFVWHMIIYKPSSEEVKINNIEMGAERLIHSLAKTKSKFRAVTGSARAELWNREDVIEAIKEALDRKVRIKIIVGPLDGGDDNKLNELERMEKYKKYLEIKSLLETPEIHFRISDDRYVYVEDMSYHPKRGKYTRRFTIYHNNFNKVNHYRRKFSALCSR